jgi:hypothetical protein
LRGLSGALVSLSAVVLAACGGGAASAPPPGASGALWLTLPPGSRYFGAADGRRAPVVTRDVSASSAAAFTPLFAAVHANGTTLVRLQLTQRFGYDTLGKAPAGTPLLAGAGRAEQLIVAVPRR